MTTAQAWIRDHAQSLNDKRPVYAAAKDAVIVAIGENTRESAEIDRHRIDLTKNLVEAAGFRIIVIPDSANVAERMDEYVLGKRSDLHDVVLSGWLPNRTEATADLLQWARGFNEQQVESPVRIIGNGPRQIEPPDYDQIAAYADQVDPAAARRIREHYDVIRTAHEVNEHIQTHQGIHPGRPFAELAHEALDLVRGLPDGESKAATLALAEATRDFHGNSFAAKPDLGELSQGIADRIVTAHEETGQKVIYFDGFALTGVMSNVDVAVNAGNPFATPGHLLRERYGNAYVSVLLAFGHGTIRDGLVIPEPSEGYVERALADSGAGEVLLPFRDSGGEWPDTASRLRIIAGVYDPDEDDKHGIDLPSLRQSADFLGSIEVISQTRPFAIARPLA
ncbi:erythromycin esterase family protein [Glycomyces buryatensis]|nr:erythromycin esterase family protein [Glycomyces buryatensis]